MAAVEYKERNDLERGVRSDTVGGLFVVHHSALYTMVEGGDPASATIWPVHEVGRNADVFDENAGRLLAAGSTLLFPSTHLHSNGTDTRAHIDVAFKFHPPGYEPEKQMELLFVWQRSGSRHPPAGVRPARRRLLHAARERQDQRVRAPHARPGVRMCLEAVWGTSVQTLNCAGYDHNWVRVYKYADDAAPLLPKGTILHLTGFFDNSPTNPNVVDPRNWSGSGHRSVDNMFINLMQALYLNDEEFAAAVAEREAAIAAGGGPDIGVPRLRRRRGAGRRCRRRRQLRGAP